MRKEWKLFPQTPGLSILEQILKNRGITETASFLNPRLANLKDPFDIPNIEKAAEQVLLAIGKNRKILVYGDYDVDGVTGTAILLETLQYLGATAGHYIPSRYGEGYSMNLEAVKKAKEEKVELIITVDCGISNLKEIELANRLGIDVVVTDHHNVPETLPPALAIVNPKMIPASHPSKNLAGAGVAFKFAWVLLRKAEKKDNAFLTDLLDLAALGTVADAVPLTEENRIIAYAGLNILNQKKRLGINHLIEAALLTGEINIHHVKFALAPSINAAGRLEHASMSLNLLKADNAEEATKIAKELNSINIRRQNIGSLIQKEVFARIESEKLDQNKVIILKGENWHPGVIGIVASQVADKYYRPAVLISNGRGSARSIDEINVYEILAACRDLYSSFGGHAGAAGFELKEGSFDEFCKRIEERANELIKDLTPHIMIDRELSISEMTLALAHEINRLSPFGEGNPPPVFMTGNLPLEEIRQVGSDKKHLKLKLGGLDAIGFNLGTLAPTLTLSKKYDMVYNLKNDEWNGFDRLQANLIDIKEK